MTVVPIINQQLDDIEAAIRLLAGNYNTTDYHEIVYAIRHGHADQIPNGSTFIVPHTQYGNIEFITRARNQHKVVGEPSRPTITIQARYLLPGSAAATSAKTFTYDRQEAMCKIAEAIPANTVVKFTSTKYGSWEAGDWHFTTINEIPAGALIGLNKSQNTTLGQCSAVVYLTPKDTAPNQTCALSSGDGSATVNLGTWGTGSMNHAHRISYGSNNDAESNIFFWLNCNGITSEQWQPKTQYDMLDTGYINLPGFLGGFSEDFRSYLGLCAVPNISNNAFEAQDSQYETNSTYSHNGYFFLPSRKEIYGTDENTNESDEIQFDYLKILQRLTQIN